MKLLQVFALSLALRSGNQCLSGSFQWFGSSFPIQAIDRIHDATVLYEYLLHILASVRKRHHDSIIQGTAIGPQLCMYRYLSPNVIHAAKEVMQANSTPYCLNKYKTT
ncbi:hypothetical protein HDV62DRAFT_384233 [Trichoderma sp. SZMC 28011]